MRPRLDRGSSGLPAERAHLDEADEEAARTLEAAQATLAQDEAALARAKSDDARVAARLAVTRAAAGVRAEEERRERLVARRATLEDEAEQLAVEARDLERRATEVAVELGRSARVSPTEAPGPGLMGLVEWGSRAHAAIVVARSGLDAEREHIVREANELASSVLGEPLYTGSVAHVRRRLQEELA